MLLSVLLMPRLYLPLLMVRASREFCSRSGQPGWGAGRPARDGGTDDVLGRLLGLLGRGHGRLLLILGQRQRARPSRGWARLESRSIVRRVRFHRASTWGRQKLWITWWRMHTIHEAACSVTIFSESSHSCLASFSSFPALVGLPTFAVGTMYLSLHRGVSDWRV